MKTMLLMLSVLLSSTLVLAGETVEYKSGKDVMEGYLAQPETKRLRNPAVLIVHDWMGPSEFTKKKADEMAQMGYVAFAADIYGKGVRPKNPQEAGALAGKLKGDQKLMRERIKAGYDFLAQTPGINSDAIVAFGYCLGGTTVLELARSGAQLAGVASFHGGLATKKSDDAKNIKGKVLVMHGAIDPFVPEKEVLGFQKAMNKAGVDYKFVAYSGAVHAFAVPAAGKDPKSGAAYNETADRRSWEDFKSFLSEVAPL